MTLYKQINHESWNETWNTMCMAWHGLEKHGSMLTSKLTQKQKPLTTYYVTC